MSTFIRSGNRLVSAISYRLLIPRNQSVQVYRNFSDKSSDPPNDDLPDPSIPNPYVKEKPQCILCRFQIEVDYKNVRLLSQFVSPHTGRMYDKHITGLCEKQHRALRKEIRRAQMFGLLSPFYRDPKYNNDPKLFDPTRPQRPNPY